MRSTASSFFIKLLMLALVFAAPVAPAWASGDDGDYELHGTIESLPASGLIGDWVVSGVTIHVTSSTEVKQEHGTAAVGAAVEVKGDQLTDGTVNAHRIEVEPTGGDDGGGDDDDGNDDEIHGTIESLPASGLVGDWVVSGRTVHVSASTLIEQEHGQVAVGASVEVHGTPQSDGSLDAIRIEVNPTGGGDDNGGGGSGGGGDDNGGGGSGDDNGGGGSGDDNGGGSGDDNGGSGEAKFFGTVESLPAELVGTWTVSGRTVVVNASTVIEREHGATPAVGSYVEVEGAQIADGAIQARKVEVKTGAAGSTTGYTELRGTVASIPAGRMGAWTVGGRTVLVTEATSIKEKKQRADVGAFVEVRGNLRQDGSVDAARIEVKSSGARLEKFYGTIESTPASGLTGEWVIAGRTVVVTGSTIVEQQFGAAVVGAYVEVKGRPGTSGLTASKIEVKSTVGGTGGGYIEIRGTIESMPVTGIAGEWVVSGRTIHVTEGVRLRERRGQARIGAAVEVEGNQRQDGSIDAAKIDVKN